MFQPSSFRTVRSAIVIAESGEWKVKSVSGTFLPDIMFSHSAKSRIATRGGLGQAWHCLNLALCIELAVDAL